MKILGIANIGEGRQTLYLKPDSSLLVNRKPFFIPDFAQCFQANPCLVLKINRLGKNIAPRFANRYFSEAALGYNISVAHSTLLNDTAETADSPSDTAEGTNETSESTLSTLAFDYSAVVGEFQEYQGIEEATMTFMQQDFRLSDLICSPQDALSRLSRYVTLRMGDMVCIDFATKPLTLVPELVLTAHIADSQTLLCRVK